MMKGIKRTVLVMACLAGLTTSAAALDAAGQCETAKLKLAGKYGLCRLKAEATALRAGGAPEFAKCDAKFTGKWSAAELAAGGQCQTSGDEAALQDFTSQHTGEVAAALAGGPLPDCPVDLASCQVALATSESDLASCEADLAICEAVPLGQPLRTNQTTCYLASGAVVACGTTSVTAGQDGEVQRGLPRAYVDNGDGTISDLTTGLIWERLSNDGSIHDMAGGFDFQHAHSTKAILLNFAAFAGYSDWRVPNRNELESLVDLGRAAPAIDPVFNTGCVAGCTIANCSCTAALGHWSSTSDHNAPLNGWVVDFNYGDVRRFLKTGFASARLVRGGS
jgi:Protein of unknown function (DUF1566)